MSGIITGPYFKKYFDNPGAGELGLMVSVLEIGALSTSSKKFAGTPQPFILFRCSTVTSLAAGRIGDAIGRRGTLFTGAVVFTIGGAIQTFTGGIPSMVVGRFISGFGVGLLS